MEYYSQAHKSPGRISHTRNRHLHHHVTGEPHGRGLCRAMCRLHVSVQKALWALGELTHTSLSPGSLYLPRVSCPSGPNLDIHAGQITAWNSPLAFRHIVVGKKKKNYGDLFSFTGHQINTKLTAETLFFFSSFSPLNWLIVYIWNESAQVDWKAVKPAEWGQEGWRVHWRMLCKLKNIYLQLKLKKHP